MPKPCDIIDWDKEYKLQNNPEDARVEIWQDGKLICYAHHDILGEEKRPEQLVDSKAYDVLQTHYDYIYPELKKNLHHTANRKG